MIVGAVVLVAGAAVAAARVRRGGSVKSSVRRIIPMALIGVTVAATQWSLLISAIFGILALVTAAINFAERQGAPER